jgi:HEAT repeat protein
MRLKITVIALLLEASLAFGQTWSESDREILMLQDQRSLGNGKLITFLSSPDPQLRYLANIQDASTDSSAVLALRDPDARVRAVAAFALGQIGGGISQDSLLSCLRAERDSTVVARMLEALGRIGDAEALNQVVDFPNGEQSSFVAAEQAMSLARFALRGIKSEQSIWHCFALLANPSSDVRWKSLFALWRTAPHGLIDVEIAKRESLLTALMTDPDADVRLNLELCQRSDQEFRG